jgi:hypothetical protein
VVNKHKNLRTGLLHFGCTLLGLVITALAHLIGHHHHH